MVGRLRAGAYPARGGRSPTCSGGRCAATAEGSGDWRRPFSEEGNLRAARQERGPARSAAAVIGRPWRDREKTRSDLTALGDRGLPEPGRPDDPGPPSERLGAGGIDGWRSGAASRRIRPGRDGIGFEVSGPHGRALGRSASLGRSPRPWRQRHGLGGCDGRVRGRTPRRPVCARRCWHRGLAGGTAGSWLMHPLICRYQITPKISLNTRCSASMLPNFSIKDDSDPRASWEDGDTASTPAETTNASAASPCSPSTNGHTRCLGPDGRARRRVAAPRAAFLMGSAGHSGTGPPRATGAGPSTGCSPRVGNRVEVASGAGWVAAHARGAATRSRWLRRTGAWPDPPAAGLREALLAQRAGGWNCRVMDYHVREFVQVVQTAEPVIQQVETSLAG